MIDATTDSVVGVDVAVDAPTDARADAAIHRAELRERMRRAIAGLLVTVAPALDQDKAWAMATAPSRGTKYAMAARYMESQPMNGASSQT